MDAVTALPNLARGMLDGISRRIGLTVGKGPPFVYLSSWVPTMPAYFLSAYVLPAGTFLLGVNCTADLRFLRCFVFFFPVWFAAVCFVSTLRDAAAVILGTCCVGAPINWVIRWLGSRNFCPGPVADADGGTSPCVCSVGVHNILSATSPFVLIAFSVRRCNYSISFIMLSLPITLIVFAYLVIAVIILSAYMIVGVVVFLWLKCTVSMSRLLHVSLMWHEWVM